MIDFKKFKKMIKITISSLALSIAILTQSLSMNKNFNTTNHFNKEQRLLIEQIGANEDSIKIKINLDYLAQAEDSLDYVIDKIQEIEILTNNLKKDFKNNNFNKEELLIRKNNIIKRILDLHDTLEKTKKLVNKVNLKELFEFKNIHINYLEKLEDDLLNIYSMVISLD